MSRSSFVDMRAKAGSRWPECRNAANLSTKFGQGCKNSRIWPGATAVAMAMAMAMAVVMAMAMVVLAMATAMAAWMATVSDAAMAIG